MIFGIKEKWIILTHTMYFLAIAINILQHLKTGFVVQGHICHSSKPIFHIQSLVCQSGESGDPV